MSAAAELTLVFASCAMASSSSFLRLPAAVPALILWLMGVLSSAFQSWQSALYKSASDSGFSRVTTRIACTAKLLASQNVGPLGR